VGDLVLTEAPAQERLGAGDLRRKVDEAGVRVLHDPAELVDRVGTAGDTGMLTGDLLVEGVPAAHVAPVACDLERELPPLGLGRCEGRPVLDELFRQGPHLREQRVRLLAGEVSRRHVRMIERKVVARQRDSSESEVHPTRLAIWLALVALLTVAQIYGRYFAESDPLDDPLYSRTFAAASLTQWLLFGALVFGLAAGARQLLAVRAPLCVGRATLVAVATFLLVVATAALLSALGLNPSREQGLVPDEWPPPDQVVFAANVVLVVLVGPLVEELLFRGLGFGLLRPFGRAVAAVGSAAAFAAVHGLVEGFALIFLLGLGLAVMREVSGSVVPGFALHSAFNAVAVTAAALSSAAN
jgi:membrane protease YdiL (CAAX protease family)